MWVFFLLLYCLRAELLNVDGTHLTNNATFLFRDNVPTNQPTNQPTNYHNILLV